MSVQNLQSDAHERLQGTWSTNRWWLPDNRREVALTLLQLIAVAQRERIEIAPLVTALAQEHRWFAKWRLQRLASLLVRGVPIVAALEQVPNLLSDEQMLSLRFAEQTGVSTMAYEQLIDRSKSTDRNSVTQFWQGTLYGICLAFVSSILMTFLIAFIFPTFKAMFEEFGLDLPPLFRALLYAVDCIARYLPLLSLLVLAGVVVVLVFKPQRVFHRKYSSKLLPSVAKRRRAQLLRLVSWALGAGRPISGVLSTLARYHFDEPFRMRLLFARNEVEQGVEPWRSLCQAELLSTSESQALATAATPELRNWMVQRMADAKELQVSNRNALLASLVHPVVVILFGLLVMWVCVAMLGVLLSMILSLA